MHVLHRSVELTVVLCRKLVFLNVSFQDNSYFSAGFVSRGGIELSEHPVDAQALWSIPNIKIPTHVLFDSGTEFCGA